jgi:hypothetical protein
MDVIARRALERLNVEADWARGNPRQYSSRLAYGAECSLDHDAIAFGSGGSVTELSVTGSYRGGAVMGLAMEPFASRRWSKLLTFEKLTQL